MNCNPSSCCDFAGNYDLSALPEIKKLEQVALGCDYGGTSWTTRAQVDGIVDSLKLNADSHLLDIGAGAGWPGLLLGKLSKCNVTLLDIPLNALMQAAQRAVDDAMTDKVNIVSASATSLPFNGGSFGTISHSDVLCCLPEKLELLQESRRVGDANACMHFSVILPAEGISKDEHDKVLATGPPFVGVEGNYADLLSESGWRVVEVEDVSDEYGKSLQRLVGGIRENESELTELLGGDELAAKRVHREEQIALVESGLMRREAYLAIAV